MNSALQCLLHTKPLVQMFLGDWRRDRNEDNPLGMGGELADAYHDLIRAVWKEPKMKVYTPR